MSKLSEILAGWKNYSFPNPTTEKLAKERSQQCSGCEKAVESGVLVLMVSDELEEIQGYKCTACKPNCPLSAKIRSPEAICELGKWKS